MASASVRRVTIESEPFAPFGAPKAGGGGGGEPPDPEAAELANAAIFSAALALGIYIDTFV